MAGISNRWQRNSLFEIDQAKIYNLVIIKKLSKRKKTEKNNYIILVSTTITCVGKNSTEFKNKNMQEEKWFWNQDNLSDRTV